jgi:hypothetical protein
LEAPNMLNGAPVFGNVPLTPAPPGGPPEGAFEDVFPRILLPEGAELVPPPPPNIVPPACAGWLVDVEPNKPPEGAAGVLVTPPNTELEDADGATG